MHVGDLFGKQELHSLSRDATAMDAARAMTAARVGAILVLAEDGALAGIFTERDLMSRVVVPGRDPARTPLAEVMTSEVYAVGPDADLATVRRELQRRHIRHLPIVVGGRVIGMVSLRDVLRADLAEKAREVREMENYFLGGEGPP